MPPRDVARLGPLFLIVYLFAGPLLAGAGLGAVTRLLRPGVRRLFDRLATAGFVFVLAAALALLGRSHGWAFLFAVPYGMALLGIMLVRGVTR